VLFYSAMFLETRYVLSSLGPILLVLALTIGTGIRVLSRNMPMRERHDLKRLRQSVEPLAGFEADQAANRPAG
jgi:hypothetical protein